MTRAHAHDSTCAAMGPLRVLHPAEIAVAVEALADDDRDELARILGIGAPSLESLRDGLAALASSLDAPTAHEVARRLVSPLIPALRDGLAFGTGPLVKDLETAVMTLLDEWPPGLVHLLVVLTWEAAGLRTPFVPLDDGRS